MFEKFIEENIERDIKCFETNINIYLRYLMFCDYHHIEPISKITLSNRFKNFNVGIKHRRMKNGVIEYGRWGVKILPCKY